MIVLACEKCNHRLEYYQDQSGGDVLNYNCPHCGETYYYVRGNTKKHYKKYPQLGQFGRLESLH